MLTGQKARLLATTRGELAAGGELSTQRAGGAVDEPNQQEQGWRAGFLFSLSAGRNIGRSARGGRRFSSLLQHVSVRVQAPLEKGISRPSLLLAGLSPLGIEPRTL